MTKLALALSRWSVAHPKSVLVGMIVSTLLLIASAALPTLLPEQLSFLPAITVDTDPENMLSEHEPARVFHDANKKEFGLYDMIVVGFVNEEHPQGVFNAETLGRVHALSAYLKTLDGVVSTELLSPSTVDSIENAGPGTVRFDWLMNAPPKNDEEAAKIRDRALRVPFLKDTMVSGDGRALAVYVPLEAKTHAHAVSQSVEAKMAEIGLGGDQLHITGLPVAEDTFGVEMFIQMAISAPAAMLVIFLLMWAFFRRIVVITAPMILAMVAAISTMAALVISGNTIHIMSSMIPIFIMPIAVLDAVHIISEFFDRYEPGVSRRELVVEIMGELFRPMLFTSLTTTAGFASLALTPIPPVQVFGIFVGVGVMMAWFWTISFIPAFLVLIPDRMLEGFGLKTMHPDRGSSGRLLGWVARFTHARASAVTAVAAVLLVVAGYGISLIQVNDNPTNWFEPSHPIRVADKVLNQHFAGTYEAYLTLGAKDAAFDAERYVAGLEQRSKGRADAIREAVKALGGLARDSALNPSSAEPLAWLERLDEQMRARRGSITDADGLAGWRVAQDFLDRQLTAMEELEDDSNAKDSAAYSERFLRELDAHGVEATQGLQAMVAVARSLGQKPLDSAGAFREALRQGIEGGHSVSLAFVAEEASREDVFKAPEILAYVEKLQAALQATHVVGKSNSVVDIVKTVHRDLLGGEDKDYRIPDSAAIVAQTLQQFQSSHRKGDLWHFITPDHRKALLWVQLKSGDNRDMRTVLDATDAFIAANPLPPELGVARWSGLTYINDVWQEKMVSGMLDAFLGSFVIVLVMMVFLFRSFLWGLLSMLPLTLTVALIYGITGLIGKDYDMPVAVLSSLSLGLAVDYAIHFLARARQLRQEHGSYAAARTHLFGEPARAISRNIVVVGVGFLPLLLAPLVPYQTVGILIAAILVTAGAATLMLLPSMIVLLERFLFQKGKVAMATGTPKTQPSK